MRTILIHFPGHDRGRLFDPAARDAVLEPFIHLKDRLAEMGRELQTADERRVEGCERILFWDFPDGLVAPSWPRRVARRLRHVPSASVRPLYTECIRAGLRKRLVLFTGEPPVVLPANWAAKTHARFDTVLTWSDRLVDGKKFHKFRWPVTQVFPDVVGLPFAQRKLLVNVSAHKRSDHPQDLYGERRATIRHFEAAAPQDFDLYGSGWDEPGPGEPSFPSYRGRVANKWDLLPRYRFGLCYENMRDEPGWITEKIFDCMRADCVPVYWGASNVADYVDPEAFVDRRRFSDNAELERRLRSMGEAEHERYRGAIRDYLGSGRFRDFLSPAFAAAVLGVLRLDPS